MNALTERFFWPTLGVLTYGLALFFFQPQSWQDIALPFIAEGNLSLPIAWFYHYREPALLNMNGFLHPQIPLFSLLWIFFPAGGAQIFLHMINILLLGSGLFRGKSPLLLFAAAFAGYHNGIPLFGALMFSAFAQPLSGEKSLHTAARYLLLTILTPLASLSGVLLLATRINRLRWKTAAAALCGMLLAALALLPLLRLDISALGNVIFALNWTRLSAKMQPMWLVAENLPAEVWVIAVTGLTLIFLRLLLEKKIQHNEKTPPRRLFTELSLFMTLPWLLSFGQSWSLLLLLPARIAMDGRLTATRAFQAVGIFSAGLLLILAAKRQEPPLVTARLPAALAVGIDDLHGHDDLLLVRNSRVRIYLTDLKVIPENYALAQMGIPDESGENRFLFSPAARRFFIAEQQYAEAMQSVFAAEPERGILVSGNDPMSESKPFSRARQIFEKYQGTRLLLINDW